MVASLANTTLDKVRKRHDLLAPAAVRRRAFLGAAKANAIEAGLPLPSGSAGAPDNENHVDDDPFQVYRRMWRFHSCACMHASKFTEWDAAMGR